MDGAKCRSMEVGDIGIGESTDEGSDNESRNRENKDDIDDIPKPQPRAPPTTFARDPIRSSQSRLGGKGKVEKTAKGKDSKRGFRRARFKRRPRRQIFQRGEKTNAPKEIAKEKPPKEKERNAPRR